MQVPLAGEAMFAMFLLICLSIEHNFNIDGMKRKFTLACKTTLWQSALLCKINGYFE